LHIISIKPIINKNINHSINKKDNSNKEENNNNQIREINYKWHLKNI
jgi:hypothetical protein